MAYVRFSIVRPMNGREREVQDLMTRLLDFYSKQEGYLEGYVLTDADGSDTFGRMSVWTSSAAADRIAQLESNLAIRAELDRVVLEDGRTESAFIGEPATQ